jgi:hypothetical protein
VITKNDRGTISAPNGLHFVADVPAWVLVISGLPFAAFMWHEHPWQAIHSAGSGGRRR